MYYRFKIEVGETQKFGELLVELPEKFEVVVLLYHHCIEDDEGAFGVKEEQRYPIVSAHL